MMKFHLNSYLLRKAALLVLPLGLLSGGSLFAQWSPGYSYDEGRAVRRHQHDEKHDLKDHQKEERYYYGNSRALREHQKEERHQLRHHQHDERDYDNRDYRSNDRRYNSDGYYGRRD